MVPRLGRRLLLAPLVLSLGIAPLPVRPERVEGRTDALRPDGIENAGLEQELTRALAGLEEPTPPVLEAEARRRLNTLAQLLWMEQAGTPVDPSRKSEALAYFSARPDQMNQFVPALLAEVQRKVKRPSQAATNLAVVTILATVLPDEAKLPLVQDVRWMKHYQGPLQAEVRATASAFLEKAQIATRIRAEQRPIRQVERRSTIVTPQDRSRQTTVTERQGKGHARGSYRETKVGPFAAAIRLNILKAVVRSEGNLTVAMRLLGLSQNPLWSQYGLVNRVLTESGIPRGRRSTQHAEANAARARQLLERQRQGRPIRDVSQLSVKPLQDLIRRFEQQQVRSTLRRVHGNVTEAARRLGMYPQTLHEKLKAWGDDLADYRRVDPHPSWAGFLSIRKLEEVAIRSALERFKGNMNKAAKGLRIGRRRLRNRIKRYRIAHPRYPSGPAPRHPSPAYLTTDVLPSTMPSLAELEELVIRVALVRSQRNPVRHTVALTTLSETALWMRRGRYGILTQEAWRPGARELTTHRLVMRRAAEAFLAMTVIHNPDALVGLPPDLPLAFSKVIGVTQAEPAFPPIGDRDSLAAVLDRYPNDPVMRKIDALYQLTVVAPMVQKPSLQDSWYEVLGVPFDADEPTIHQAFTALAKQHHPDRTKREGRMTEINLAYRTLINVARRETYNTALMARIPRRYVLASIYAVENLVPERIIVRRGHPARVVVLEPDHVAKLLGCSPRLLPAVFRRMNRLLRQEQLNPFQLVSQYQLPSQGTAPGAQEAGASALAGLEEALAAGHAGRERLDVGA